MSWRAAFLRQAQSDNRVRQLLNKSRAEYCHQLHYLQMSAEKLAKAILQPPSEANPPEPTHAAFVRMLQTLKGQPRVRRLLGYQDAAAFAQYINSLLDLALEIEQLAPALAGFNRANAEYPWGDPITGRVHAPADFAFPAFDARNTKMIQMEKLLTQLLHLEI